MASSSRQSNPNYERIQRVDLPVIDLALPRRKVAKLIVKACEDYGFFNVVNHGVSLEDMTRMERESLAFFSKSESEKQLAAAGPYGSRTIGPNGDMGELEYLLFKTDKASIAQSSMSISNNPRRFSSVVNKYIKAVKELASELLDLIGEGLRLRNTSVFSSLIGDVDSDSLFRLNYYPPTSASPTGFGEHTDIHILTILRSNGVGGLQISPQDGVWIPVVSDPTAFCVNVGDLLQAMTNGRLVSVKHRVVTNNLNARLSMGLFFGPSIETIIEALPEMVTSKRPPMYRPFTFDEYRRNAYSLRLGDNRIDAFRI